MKELLTTLLIALAFSFTAEAQETTTITVYRPGQFAGAAANFTIFVNDKAYCKLSNNKYITFDVPAGKQSISARVSGLGINAMKKVKTLDITTKPNEAIFIKGDIKSSITRVRMELTQVFASAFEGSKKEKEMGLDNCQLEDE